MDAPWKQVVVETAIGPVTMVEVTLEDGTKHVTTLDAAMAMDARGMLQADE